MTVKIICGVLAALVMSSVAYSQTPVQGSVVLDRGDALRAMPTVEDAVVVEYVEYGEVGDSARTRMLLDASGRFEFLDVPGEMGVVTIRATGYSTAWHRWPPTSGGTELEVILTQPVRIHGRVVDDDTGGSIADATVTAFMQHNGNMISDTTTGDDAGMFVMLVPTQPSSVTAWADGYAPSRVAFAYDGYDVEVSRLRRMGSVVGMVQDESGLAMAGAYIRVRYEVEEDGYLPGWDFAASLAGERPISTGDGIVEIGEVIPGVPLVLQAELEDGRRSEERVVEIEPGSQRNVVVLVVR